MPIKKTAINIHHTAMYAEDDVAEQFEAVNNAHRQRWNGKTKSKMGYYSGYHYIIERSGTVQQFRGDEETGAHNNKGLKRIGAWMYSANHYAIGIVFAGNMSRQHLTPEQIKSGVELIYKLQERHNIQDGNILPHRHYKATQCPGNNIHDKTWVFLKEQYKKLDNKTPDIVKWCKAHGLITSWVTPYRAEDLKDAWMLYKLGRGIVTKKLNKSDFNL